MPLQLNTCETDMMFPIESQAKADEIFGDGEFAPGYERTYWPGCFHGFAVRGDLVSTVSLSPRDEVNTTHLNFREQSDPKIKAGKEGAFKAAVEFLLSYF